ncbi:hypothetical protein K9L27_02080 [Candidatus Gracilibacteria bacterium]|nr:hypothetical protein [Candidatus Gracilibacteria bacterium]
MDKLEHQPKFPMENFPEETSPFVFHMVKIVSNAVKNGLKLSCEDEQDLITLLLKFVEIDNSQEEGFLEKKLTAKKDISSRVFSILLKNSECELPDSENLKKESIRAFENRWNIAAGEKGFSIITVNRNEKDPTTVTVTLGHNGGQSSFSLDMYALDSFKIPSNQKELEILLSGTL